MAVLLMLSLGAGMTLATMTETTIAANYRDGLQALYAAEAGMELAISRLRTVADWRAVAGTTVLHGNLADLLQSGSISAAIDVAVSASADPGGDADVLVLQSSASGPGAIRRNVEVTIRRLPPAGEGARTIQTVSWR